MDTKYISIDFPAIAVTWPAQFGASHLSTRKSDECAYEKVKLM